MDQADWVTPHLEIIGAQFIYGTHEKLTEVEIGDY